MASPRGLACDPTAKEIKKESLRFERDFDGTQIDRSKGIIAQFGFRYFTYKFKDLNIFKYSTLY